MEWRDVVGFEGFYEVSEYGHIRRLAISYSGKDPSGKSVVKSKKDRYYPKFQINRKGYEVTSLSIVGTGRKKNVLVHRVVAEAFLDNFSPALTVDHLDCNKTNNHYSNLEAVTNRENLLRSHRYGTHSKFTQKPKKMALNWNQVKEIRALYSLNPNSDNPRKRDKKRPYCQRTLAKMFNTNQTTIREVVTYRGAYARDRF